MTILIKGRSWINTVNCDGKVVMTGRRVEGEKEIIEGARQSAFDLHK